MGAQDERNFSIIMFPFKKGTLGPSTLLCWWVPVYRAEVESRA